MYFESQSGLTSVRERCDHWCTIGNSILKFYFRQINLYNLQEWKDELHKIISQKYRFYNTFSRSGTSQEVKNTALWYEVNSFCAGVN